MSILSVLGKRFASIIPSNIQGPFNYISREQLEDYMVFLKNVRALSGLSQTREEEKDIKCTVGKH